MEFSFGFIQEKIKKIFNHNNHYAGSKIKLIDNQPLSINEYNLVCRICDIFTALQASVTTETLAPPQGGIFWNKARPGTGPFELYLRKNKAEIEHLLLLFNAFRDFCALAYELDAHTPKPDYWIRRYLRISSAMEKKWRARLPARFGEIGWDINGYPVNRWTSVNQERLSALKIAGVLDYLEQQACARLLEIGGGAGEIAYVYSKALPNSTWYNADLLGCLIYSTIQLSINLPNKKHYIYVGNTRLSGKIDESLIIRCPQKAAHFENAHVYIPHFLLEDFSKDLKLHFAYNTYSFGEMPGTAVSHYASLLSAFLKDQGILFEQNGYFPEKGGAPTEEILARFFTQLPWPPQFDGRLFPNGPLRIWCNNAVGEKIQKLISPKQIDTIISSLLDHGDTVDIQYQNEILWPKVYELFAAQQEVASLYPW